ncbi:MAG: hypothetical protein JW932_00240 [Deltaproteobacteria bacterium]|nr:hypothetical protein [Deltaproteobacteria bacterium]
MKKNRWIMSVVCLMAMGILSSSAQARNTKYSFGLTYVSGFDDIVDIYENNLEKEGYSIYSSDYVPAGISFRSDTRIFNHFSLGVGVGPFMYISAEEYDFFNIPSSIFIRYTFNSEANATPYICGGISNHFASGDYVEDTSPGFMAGVGIEFLRNKRVNMGVLAIYDSSEIELKKHQSYSSNNHYDDTIEAISPGEFMLGVFIIF